jgi:hypothetical protein
MFNLFGNSDEPKPTSPADYKIAPEHRKLWDQLCAFVFDEPGAAYPFSARLAKRNSYRGGWSQEYAVRVLDEYRKFLYLLRTAGHDVTPSMAVDEAWHIHLIYTRSYWVDLCLKIFGVAVHHQPGNGNDEDTAMWAAVYERTLDDYTKVFGTPPVDIWGKPNPDIDWRAELAKHNFDTPRREDPTLSVFQK